MPPNVSPDFTLYFDGALLLEEVLEPEYEPDPEIVSV
jgi:predicted RNA-binding protein